MARAIYHLEPGLLGEFGELELKCGQQVTPDRLVRDREHGQRQLAECAGSVQLVPARCPRSSLSRFGRGEPGEGRGRVAAK